MLRKVIESSARGALRGGTYGLAAGVPFILFGKATNALLSSTLYTNVNDSAKLLIAYLSLGGHISKDLGAGIVVGGLAVGALNGAIKATSYSRYRPIFCASFALSVLCYYGLNRKEPNHRLTS